MPCTTGLSKKASCVHAGKGCSNCHGVFACMVVGLLSPKHKRMTLTKKKSVVESAGESSELRIKVSANGITAPLELPSGSL